MIMLSIDVDNGVGRILSSLLGERLSLLAGAGLSMAPPSNLPSAAAIAARVNQRYMAQYGPDAPPIPTEIDAQAEYFFDRHELQSVFFRSLMDFDAFAGPPNAGHFAVADLLLVRGIQTAATTNVDTLVETAGQLLMGQIGVGIDGHAVASLPPNVSPFLKIHGCRAADPLNMIWARGQLGAEPVATRISRSAEWLRVGLLDRDLLIVGYWTDWDYLNNVLGAVMNAVSPATVIVVDPANTSAFRDKAPVLFALGSRAASGFFHVQASGADFLDALRLRFSRSFVRQVLHDGAQDFSVQKGVAPAPAWLEPPSSDNQTMWQIRRDLAGTLPNDPAKELRPVSGGMLGQTLLELQARGAVPDGTYWNLGGQRIRVLRAGRPLHRVQADFERETAPAIAPDIVIAVGAEAQALPSSIARASTAPTIARGSASRWLTRQDAIAELSL